MKNPSWIIEKKRDGKELSRDEIQQFIDGLITGDVCDYQAAAFLMATFFRGMSLNETLFLTEAMLKSGERFEFSEVTGPKIDKHSTGGVGDKVSIILAPLASACGLRVPMMSGRALGHSGGTLDKLESITGFQVDFNQEKCGNLLNRVGCFIIGQSDRMVPADRKLYALRDVTGTIPSIPLITASILSKKLAEGAEGLVLDIKTGSGAFMKTREQARKLARVLSQVAKKMGLRCRILITNMDQPLGYSVGNAIEVQECVEILRNQKNPDFCSGDLKELTIQLCAHMLLLGNMVHNLTSGRKLALSRLTDGSAWSVFQEMVRAQGGDVDQVRNHENLPRSPIALVWRATERGYISRIDTETIGRLTVELGAGRGKLSDSVDPGSGLIFHRKLGARVQPGDQIVSVYTKRSNTLEWIEKCLNESIEICKIRKAVPKLILEQD